MSSPIVIVDDDLNYLSVMKLVLEPEGFEIMTATNGKAAKDAINKHLPEVVLVDWNMPEADGVNLIREWRADPRHAERYYILVTARREVQSKLEGMEAGADDYLTKPFDNQELLARVRVGIRTRNLQKELAEQTRRTTVYEMAVSVAHEIGNPLATAKLLQQSLSRNPLLSQLSKVRDDLETLAKQLNRIETLVRKAQSLTLVKSVPYVNDITMIDLSDHDEEQQGER